MFFCLTRLAVTLLVLVVRRIILMVITMPAATTAAITARTILVVFGSIKKVRAVG